MDSNTVLDVNQSVWDFFFKRHPFIFFFLIILPVLVSIGLGYLEFILGSATVLQNQSTEQGAFFVTLLPLVVTFATIGLVRSRIEKLFYTELATALGCTYQAVSKAPTDAQLAHIGSGNYFTNTFSGTYSNFPFQLGDYTYYTGNGKSQKMHVMCTHFWRKPVHSGHGTYGTDTQGRAAPLGTSARPGRD